MLVKDLVATLEQIAPTRYAQEWDNVGLLVGDPGAKVTQALLTIDYTPPVAREAAEGRFDFVIAYHPTIFKPLKRLTSSSVVYDAIRAGIAIYSPHTALDAAPGGTNDVLADAIGLVDRSPLQVIETKSKQHKLVVFVPEEALTRVSDALFDAGAGQIGNYTRCSFFNPGTGTFFGEQGTNPAVGQSGKLERAPELRLETIVPSDRIEPVLRALRQAHPYEEPAFDLAPLSAAPEGLGIGRIGAMPQPKAVETIVAQVKQQLGLKSLLIAGPRTTLIERAAVCAGSCGDLLDPAIRQGAQLYLTGEMRHHDALKAASAGVTVVCTLHSNSERRTLHVLRDRLAGMHPGVGFQVSRHDADPFEIG